MVQPPHFIAEVAAVLAREKQEDAYADLKDLQRLEWDVIQDESVYSTAVKLSVNSGQHLFDTLYHAAALQTEDAILVTADERYFEKAEEVGRIVRLRDFRLPG
jgi:predicted nucleic acid-binding protein